MTSGDEEYLGDGLFVSTDGWQVKLLGISQSAARDGGDHEVYLDQDVLKAFLNWLKRTGADK